MSRLSVLQREILRIVAEDPAPWRLTGGGALVGYHLAHRQTHDIDLFLGDAKGFEREPDVIRARFHAAGLGCATLQSSPGFVRLEVSRADEAVVVDLVAEPVPVIEPPVRQAPGILVDTPHEILVNKLNALLSRAEVRDLVDVKALTEAGGALEQAIEDASAKDGGFSPGTLAWVLDRFPLHAAESLGFDPGPLSRFRDELVAMLLGEESTEAQ